MCAVAIVGRAVLRGGYAHAEAVSECPHDIHTIDTVQRYASYVEHLTRGIHFFRIPGAYGAANHIVPLATISLVRGDAAGVQDFQAHWPPDAVSVDDRISVTKTRLSKKGAAENK